MKVKKKKFCIIGLGNLGHNIAVNLFENGHEVTVIDLDKDRVQNILDHCTIPIVGDASNKAFLEANGINEMYAVVVATGEHSDLTILITLLLVELGVPRILARAKSEEHKRILEKVGATDIIFPEKDVAINIAEALSNTSILEFITLSEDYSITEVIPPDSFYGKSFIELDLRKKYHVNVIAVKNANTEEYNINPNPEAVIARDDILIILGKIDDLEILLKNQ